MRYGLTTHCLIASTITIAPTSDQPFDGELPGARQTTREPLDHRPSVYLDGLVHRL